MCNKCGSKKQVEVPHEPPLTHFSAPTSRVTDGEISFGCQWVRKDPVTDKTSLIPAQARVSKTTVSSLAQIQQLYEILNSFPKELIAIMLQYAGSPTANLSSIRSLCRCPDSLQFSDFGKYRKALKTAFPTDSVVDQLGEVPAMTALVTRPNQSNWVTDHHILELTFPASTSLSFRVFYYQTTVVPMNRYANDLCAEAQSGSIYSVAQVPPGQTPSAKEEGSVARISFLVQHPECPTYTTALIAAVNTSSQKIHRVVMCTFVDHPENSKETTDSFPAYREGILKGLPVEVLVNDVVA